VRTRAAASGPAWAEGGSGRSGGRCSAGLTLTAGNESKHQQPAPKHRRLSAEGRRTRLSAGSSLGVDEEDSADSEAGSPAGGLADDDSVDSASDNGAFGPTPSFDAAIALRRQVMDPKSGAKWV
jgi:hypothetical protein